MELSIAKQQELERAFNSFTYSKELNSIDFKTLGVKEDLCDNWPKARVALNFIASLPMVPDDVKLAIKTVISAGDTASSIICI